MATFLPSNGLPGEIEWKLPIWLLVSCLLVFWADAEFFNTPLDSFFVSPARAPLEAVMLHGSHEKLSPHLTQNHASPPSEAPKSGPPLTTGQPPVSSQLSKPLMKRNKSAPSTEESVPPQSPEAAPARSRLPEPLLSPEISNCCGPDMVLIREESCHCVYPMKLDLLLLNVSQNPNWNLFLDKFASGLDLRSSQIQINNFYWVTLSSLNISLDITPYTGISFSSTKASAINSSLLLHKVSVDLKLVGVGDYKLLNVTWYQPPPPSPAPLSAPPPMKVPFHQASSSAAPVAPHKRRIPSLVIVISIGAGFLVFAIACVLNICCRLSHQKPEPSLKDPENSLARSMTSDAAPSGGSLPHPSSTRFLQYEELKKATNNFEKASILGEGGFGRVFKGVLSDGTAVAIKRLTNGGPQGDKEFLVEVEMLSRLHHRNLVKLVGYYSCRDSSQNLLCYELVPNGSLEAWLHGPRVDCPLDWDTRMKIALDAARGLAYLHEDSQPAVIHRDFKASNVLLENNFHAKVADFGLAKQAPEGRQSYLSTRVMGTFGYVAPEYAMTGHLLVKSDVYSYGVVLLELLTGRRPVDMSQPSGQENLVTWARPILRDKDQLEELADPKLQGKYPKDDFIRVCTIAAACVAPEANQRPTMGEVVQSLKMVQRVTEYQDNALGSSANMQPNIRQSSTTFESDGTSSIFSSGRYSGLSAFDDNISRTAIFSEDLQEGR